MTTAPSSASDQPRGENGHQAGEFSERKFTAPAAATALNATGDLSVRATDVRPGDLVFGVDTGKPKLLGRATFIHPSSHQSGRTVIRLAGGGAATIDDDELVAVHRDQTALGYDPEAPEEDRLGAAFHSLTTAHVLRQIMERETDDEFFFAVVSHPNATAPLINRAAKNPSFLVRDAATKNPRTPPITLRRIRDDALTAKRDAEDAVKRNGVSRMFLWEIQAQGRLADAASAALLARLGE